MAGVVGAWWFKPAAMNPPNRKRGASARRQACQCRPEQANIQKKRIRKRALWRDSGRHAAKNQRLNGLGRRRRKRAAAMKYKWFRNEEAGAAFKRRASK